MTTEAAPSIALDRTAARRAPRAREPGHSRAYGLFVLPALILSLAIVLVPGVMTFVYAFADWDGVSQPYWIGLDNFEELLSDGVFWRAVYNNVTWTVVFLTVPMALGLVAASILTSRRRSHAVYQIIFLVPYVLSPVVNAAIWTNMVFNPISGVLSFVDRNIVDVANPLAQPATALYTVAAVDIWHFWGYLTVVFFAAMRQTPEDQLEAAYLEGASAWQIFRHVTLPNIAPTILLMMVIVTIFSFLTFDYVYLMTGGGPARSTELLSTLAYDLAFRTFQAGKAAAVALFMSLFGLLASIAYVWMSRESLRR